MEYFLRCYLDYFDTVPRNCLHDRRRRKCMVEYISTLIEGCSSMETDIEDTCRIAVNTIISYHDEKKKNNGTVCMMGKYHNILYVAVKICYDWQLKDTGTVSTLLQRIYACEKTFERILIGAIFGNKAPHFIAGWKSDFESQEENLNAVVYFLDKANNACLELPYSNGVNGKLFRYIDLPIESCGKASPMKLAVQLGIPDKLLIFLRLGALVYIDDEDVNVFDHILDRLLEFRHKYPYNLVSCLQLLLRAVPWIKIGEKVEPFENEYKKSYAKIMDKYSDLIEDGLVPISRCGGSPPVLKHLCRCEIRKRLWENYQLPGGIKSLPVPEKLRGYLDILED